MSKFGKALKQLGIDFEKAQEGAQRGGREEVPPGTYQMQVEEAYVSPSGPGKLAGIPHAVMRFKVMVGECKGSIHRKLQNLTTVDSDGNPVGASILLRDLKILGLEVADFDEAEERIEEIEGRICTVAVMQNGQYLNTFINALIQDDEKPAKGKKAAKPVKVVEEEEEEEEEEVEEQEEEEEAPAPRRGRPKGSKNKPKAAAAKSKDAEEEFDDDLFS